MNLYRNGLWFSWDDYLWAWSCVMTRSVYIDIEKDINQSKQFLFSERNTYALAPFLDGLNHQNVGMEAKYSTKDKCFQIITHHSWKKGEEVFIHYGDHPNHILLQEYGFILDSNLFDTKHCNF